MCKVCVAFIGDSLSPLSRTLFYSPFSPSHLSEFKVKRKLKADPEIIIIDAGC